MPSIARGSGDDPASIIATDNGFVDASGSDPTDNSVTIPPGGKVKFSYPSGNDRHNVAFWGKQPSSCTQTAGYVWGATPPLPWFTQGPGWAGECTFNDAGVYNFRDESHFQFVGSVVVTAATPSPSPTPSPTPTPSPSPSPTASPTPTATSTPTPGGGAEIDARDTSSSDTWFQDASSSDKTDNSVTVKPGDSVTFKWGPATQVHNVNFKTASKPAACTQTSGTVILPPPPLPYAPLKDWSGTCRFDTPGTYTFVCDAHSNMTGSVVVTTESGATPTPTPTPTASPTPTPPPRDTTPAPTPASWVTLHTPSSKLATVPKFVAGKLQMVASCSHIVDATVKVTISNALADTLGLDSRTIATGTGSCDGHNRLVTKLKPTDAAADALDGYKKAVKATVTLTTVGLTPALTDTRKIKLAKKGKS